MNKLTNKIINIKVVSALFVFGASLLLLQTVLAWTDPAETPPAGTTNVWTIGNNVGIGNSPSQKLHVNGAVRAGGTSPLLELGEDNNLRLYRSTNDLKIKVNNDDRIIFTSNGNMGIGSTTPTAQFHVMGNMPINLLSYTDLQSGENYNIQIQGKYGYVISTDQNFLKVFEVSNPASPSLIANVATNAGPRATYIQGNYIYIVNSGGTMQVFDISNPAAPRSIGTVSMGTTNPWAIYVQGKYAYVVNFDNNNLKIFDISNPAAPVNVGTVNTGTTPIAIQVQGRYAYVESYDGNSLIQVFDISNPATPVSVGVLSAGGNHPRDLYVQGRYAYVITQDSDFYILDISNPSSISSAGYLHIGSNPRTIFVQGKYAYIGGADFLQIVDVSNPASLINVGSVTIGTNVANDLYPQGRYLYVLAGGMYIYDLNGTYLQQLETGGIETSTLAVKGNTQIYNDLDVKGGVQIASGLAVNGASSIFSTSTDAVLTLARKGATYPTVFKQGTDGALTINNNDADIITVKSNNVGIGTTDTASYKLNISGNLNASGKIKENGGDIVPSGLIIMWSGASVPAGWLLCDGNNGTPNLIDRFVYGASTVTATGGSATYSITTANLPSHSHSISAGSTGSGGSHSHSYSGTFDYSSTHYHTVHVYISGSGGHAMGYTTVNPTWSPECQYAGNHSHTVTTTFGNEASHIHSISGTSNDGGFANTPINILPPFYKLAFIMKQ
ncbi:MAG: tail fiber protein [Candidatus Pacebacteria bacterium]|nr:tail fiber protein [Candidatus Paceibacterota bacterium]